MNSSRPPGCCSRRTRRRARNHHPDNEEQRRRRASEEYYALYVVWEDGESEIAVLEWEEDEVATLEAIAVYTTPDGPVQQEDLEKWGK